MRRAAWSGALLLMFALLTSCAPSSQQPGPVATAETRPSKVSYFALDTSLAWNYHPEGEAVTSPPIRQQVDGPTVLDGTTVTRARVQGRGLDITSYYRIEDGVFLLREDRPGARIAYDPPMQLYPSAENMGVGVSWSGSTTATVTFPEAPSEHRTHLVEVTYDYRILDERTITTPAGEFTAYVVNLTATDPTSPSEQLSEQLWFTPYVGEVRTSDDWVLSDTNALRAPRDTPPTPVTAP